MLVNLNCKQQQVIVARFFHFSDISENQQDLRLEWLIEQKKIGYDLKGKKKVCLVIDLCALTCTKWIVVKKQRVPVF